jgi:uncharacterized membrane protein (DUF4010 family)
MSSTSVTLTYSRESRTHPAAGIALGAGVLAACTVLIPRVMVASSVLAPGMLRALAAYFALPFAAGVLGTVAGWRRTRNADVVSQPLTNPLQLGAALQMAALFQVVLFAVAAARDRWGGAGLVASGAVLGLTDVDALTISMARASSTAGVEIAARAIATGVLSNTLLKLTLVFVVGRGLFRGAAATGLAAIAVALAAMLWLRW